MSVDNSTQGSDMGGEEPKKKTYNKSNIEFIFRNHSNPPPNHKVPHIRDLAQW